MCKYNDHSFEFGLCDYRMVSSTWSIIYVNWSPLRSDRAIKRFRKLCQILSSGYNKNLNERFLEKSLNYLDSLIEGKLFVDAWFDPSYGSTLPIQFVRFLRECTCRALQKIWLASFLHDPIPNRVNVRCSYLRPEDFLVKTKNISRRSSRGITEMNRVVVTNNMMEPFSPERSLKFFDDAYCVVVERDPRYIRFGSSV